jgi:hypothetical protein
MLFKINFKGHGVMMDSHALTMPVLVDKVYVNYRSVDKLTCIVHQCIVERKRCTAIRTDETRTSPSKSVQAIPARRRTCEKSELRSV